MLAESINVQVYIVGLRAAAGLNMCLGPEVRPEWGKHTFGLTIRDLELL